MKHWVWSRAWHKLGVVAHAHDHPSTLEVEQEEWKFKPSWTHRKFWAMWVTWDPVLKKKQYFFVCVLIRTKGGTAKLVLLTSFLFFLLLGMESRHVVCHWVTPSPLQNSSFGKDGLSPCSTYLSNLWSWRDPLCSSSQNHNSDKLPECLPWNNSQV